MLLNAVDFLIGFDARVRSIERGEQNVLGRKRLLFRADLKVCAESGICLRAGSVHECADVLSRNERRCQRRGLL